MNVKWIEHFARFGYAAKGVVYALVGLFALQAAFTPEGATTDQQGVIYELVDQPFEQALLLFMTLGLISYAMWRFLQAFFDADNIGSSLKGIVERFAYGISGVIYTGLAFSAIKLLNGGRRGSTEQSDETTRHWTARVLYQPFGEWLVGLGGVIMIALGFYYFYKAFTGKFRNELNMKDMSPHERKWVMLAGRLGLSSRGVIFSMIGWFLIQAAYKLDASEARAIPGILDVLLEQSYGPYLLGFVAFGLVIYGIYMGVHARYRRIHPPKINPEELLNRGQ
ncbi:MAG: DUF1206 domain-containing protein [Chroococcales cyanobacterium]